LIPTGEGRIERDGAGIHYVEWNPDGVSHAPAILLLHGLGSNARYWDRVASHLRARRVVALDITPADPARAAMDCLLADIVHATTRLDLGRPVLVGHSWGAGLGLELVARHPDLTSGFVFVDGPIDGVARIFSWEEVEAFMQPPFPRYATVEQAVAHTEAELAAAWGEDLRPFVEAGLVSDGDGFVSRLTVPVRHRLLRDLYDSDPESLWPKLQVPASALIARKSDARISRSTDTGTQRVAQLAPSVKIVRFETPHDIPLYAPAEVAQEIEGVARITIWV
jgi:pimeloyl-ACP methyl ester carboxylesterase